MFKQQYACLYATFELALHLIRPLFCLDSLEQALLKKGETLIFSRCVVDTFFQRMRTTHFCAVWKMMTMMRRKDLETQKKPKKEQR